MAEPLLEPLNIDSKVAVWVEEEGSVVVRSVLPAQSRLAVARVARRPLAASTVS
jgi:hypothetical protein